jgi:hypothetical protein
MRFTVRFFFFFFLETLELKLNPLKPKKKNIGQVETRRDRWWDKLQLIVGDDATTMFQFEHSHSDGAAWNYWLEGVVEDAERGEIVAEVSTSCSNSVPLEVCNSDSLTHSLAHTLTHLFHRN